MLPFWVWDTAVLLKRVWGGEGEGCQFSDSACNQRGDGTFREIDFFCQSICMSASEKRAVKGRCGSLRQIPRLYPAYMFAMLVRCEVSSKIGGHTFEGFFSEIVWKREV